MESRRVFYRDGEHDEFPMDDLWQDGTDLVFGFRGVTILRVPRLDVLAIEER